MAALTLQPTATDRQYEDLIRSWTTMLLTAAECWHAMDWIGQIDFDFEWFDIAMPRLARIRDEADAGILGPADSALLAGFETLLLQYAAFLAEVAEGK